MLTLFSTLKNVSVYAVYHLVEHGVKQVVLSMTNGMQAMLGNMLAAGHYKQTQWSAIIEAGINVVVSVILVFKFSLIGVAIGTLAAMAYRTVYLALYLRKNILYRKLRYFFKHLLVDACTVGAAVCNRCPVPVLFHYGEGQLFCMGNPCGKGRVGRSMRNAGCERCFQW